MQGCVWGVTGDCVAVMDVYSDTHPAGADIHACAAPETRLGKRTFRVVSRGSVDPVYQRRSHSAATVSQFAFLCFLCFFHRFPLRPGQEEEIPELEIDIDELLDLPDAQQRSKLHVSAVPDPSPVSGLLVGTCRTGSASERLPAAYGCTGHAGGLIAPGILHSSALVYIAQDFQDARGAVPDCVMGHTFNTFLHSQELLRECGKPKEVSHQADAFVASK